MLTAGMLMLLIMTVVSANRMINENATAQLQAQALASSATIANDLLLEILSKKFDGLSDSLGYQATSDFSPYLGSHWGPTATETAACPLPDSSYLGNFKSIAAYNDVDDYDGYKRIVSHNGISGFVDSVVVYYVNPGTPDTKTTSRTNFKRIEVTVMQPLYLTKDTLSKWYNAAVYTALASY
jgi:hypothetical protein